MFYYADCPNCKKDLSNFATEDNLTRDVIYCPHCECGLKLHFTETWDEDMGCLCGMFWFRQV